ncbi:hypothetical protein RND71_014383 [Anisodus tanguticus]|uniref:Uncharacterized protein n=1 Tax=Anisodus tanguticus TaxID=243964 RepID=A0AAE1VE39_9SOLA|nr:hypothetical protein RND71_014383 [Anisodus tanguticus]
MEPIPSLIVPSLSKTISFCVICEFEVLEVKDKLTIDLSTAFIQVRSDYLRTLHTQPSWATTQLKLSLIESDILVVAHMKAQLWVKIITGGLR